MNVWTHFIGFWASFSTLIILVLNYKAITMHDNSLTPKPFEADINGYDLGLLHSQKAEFKVLVRTIKRYINLGSLNEDSIEAQDAEENEWLIEVLRAEVVTKWPLVAFCLAALFCLGSSSACHLCYVRNERVSKIVTNIDYWGIALLGLGSCYPYISFKYACGPYIPLRYIFISLITVLTGVCMWATVHSHTMSPTARVSVFAVFIIACLVPYSLLFFWNDPLNSLPRSDGDFMWPVVYYAAGAFFYIYRIPECFSKTGAFDYLGASHQIFHVFVLIGIVCNYQANLKLYEERL